MHALPNSYYIQILVINKLPHTVSMSFLLLLQGQGDPPQDFTSCMFCGFANKKWTENDLDVHYWKDCALLISCPSCAQIVEIAGLPEHLLDECDAKDSYVPCNVTGMKRTVYLCL